MPLPPPPPPLPPVGGPGGSWRIGEKIDPLHPIPAGVCWWRYELSHDDDFVYQLVDRDGQPTGGTAFAVVAQVITRYGHRTWTLRSDELIRFRFGAVDVTGGPLADDAHLRMVRPTKYVVDILTVWPPDDLVDLPWRLLTDPGDARHPDIKDESRCHCR